LHTCTVRVLYNVVLYTSFSTYESNSVPNTFVKELLYTYTYCTRTCTVRLRFYSDRIMIVFFCFWAPCCLCSVHQTRSNTIQPITTESSTANTSLPSIPYAMSANGFRCLVAVLNEVRKNTTRLRGHPSLKNDNTFGFRFPGASW
jgi:hypothetical protein